MPLRAQTINLPIDGSTHALSFSGPSVILRNVDGRRTIYYRSESSFGVDDACVLDPGESVTIAVKTPDEVNTLHFKALATSLSAGYPKLQVVGYF